MSARDAESGSSDYKGGSGSAGGLGNGGIGGGMGGGGNAGGGMGGGAGRNGGTGSRTGLSTGNNMWGRDGAWARGRAGSYAQQPGAWGIRPEPAITSAPLTRGTRPATPPHPAVAGYTTVPGLLSQHPVPASAIPEGMYDPQAPAPQLGMHWGFQTPSGVYATFGAGPTPYDARMSPAMARSYDPNYSFGGDFPDPSIGTYPSSQGKQYYDRVPQDPSYRAPNIPAGSINFRQENEAYPASTWGTQEKPGWAGKRS